MKLCEFRCGEIAGVRPAPSGEITIYDCHSCGTYGIARRIEAAFSGPKDWDRAVERQFLHLRAVYIKRRKLDGTIGVFDLSGDGAGVELDFRALAL